MSSIRVSNKRMVFWGSSRDIWVSRPMSSNRAIDVPANIANSRHPASPAHRSMVLIQPSAKCGRLSMSMNAMKATPDTIAHISVLLMSGSTVCGLKCENLNHTTGGPDTLSPPVEPRPPVPGAATKGTDCCGHRRAAEGTGPGKGG